MKRIFQLCIYITITSLCGQNIEGAWSGFLNVNGHKLPLVFHVEKSSIGLVSKLDSPSQNVTGIPVASTSLDSVNKVEFVIDKIGARFKGKYDHKNTISGMFYQSGREFELILRRGMLENLKTNDRPQEPKRSYDYFVEDIVFNGGDDNVKLSGTFTRPSVENKKYPVVILISGSGPQNRDEEIANHKPFLVLADHLTRKGIAVLRYDDRGFAASTGNHMTATSKDFAQDVKAAIKYLKSRTDVAIDKIGLIGHSEGGLIAPIVANESKDVAFIVLMAGPGVSGMEILKQQVKINLQRSGASDEVIQDELRFMDGILDVITTNKGSNDLELRLKAYFLDELENEGELIQGMKKSDFIQMNVNQMIRPWYRYFVTHNPKEYLQNIKIPVFAINGDKDVQVAPENLDMISNYMNLAKNKNYKSKRYQGLNHLFQRCNSCEMAEYVKIEETMNQNVLDDISNWILKNVN